MIEYRNTAEGIAPEQLRGFFVGWANPPSPETHLELLKGSDRALIAFDAGAGRVVGFATAITDGVLSAYMPFVEVLPDWQDRGIGAELTRRMLEELKDYYAVDLVCDPALEGFYERFKMIPSNAMILRRYELQSGEGREPAAHERMSQAAKSENSKKPGWFRLFVQWLRGAKPGA